MGVITVAREFGSGGKDLARQIAERLRYDCVDKELIVEVAHAAGVSEEAVEQIDEVGETAIRRFLRELFTPSNIYALSPEYPPLIWPYVPSADLGGHDPASVQNMFIDRNEYLNIMQDTIRTLARRGNVVIVGRGCQCLLADHPNTLHVRFVAPLEYRIKAIMDEMELDHQKAKELVLAKDRQRTLYLQQNYHKNWGDATLYDLVLNTARISWDHLVDIVVDTYRRLYGA
jgi:cytidylate kinase